MYGLSLEWERCPDGVELIDLGPGKRGRTVLTGKIGGKRARYRTERRVPVRHDISDLEDPVVLRFVNARGDEARIEFLSRFGLTAGSLFDKNLTEVKWEGIEESQNGLRQLLMQIDGVSPAQTISSINAAMADHIGFALTPQLDLAGVGGAPRLALRPQSLLGFMLMEAAMIAANGARTTTCQHCEKVFITGPLTGRRSHAMFCSDRCRVAAMRKRNKAKRLSK